MREVWTLDAGWVYTAFGSGNTSEKIALRHDEFTFPALLSFSAEAEELCLEKQLHIAEDRAGKTFLLMCQGVSQPLSVSLNGIALGTMGPMEKQILDLTYALAVGETNRLSLTTLEKSEFPLMIDGFSLLVLSPCHIAPFGISYVTEWDKDQGYILTVNAEIQNQTPNASHCRLVHTVLDEQGNKLAKSTAPAHISPFETLKVSKSVELFSAIAWSEKTPILYQIETEIYEKNILIDKVTTPLGLRPLKLDARRGILRENIPLKLRGIEQAPVYSPRKTPISLLLGEAQKLLDSGINAVSLTYDLSTEARLSIYDQIGISAIVALPIKSLYQGDFEHILEVVKRLYAHPSLLMWSVSELPFSGTDPRHTALMQRLSHLLKTNDPAHFIGAEVSPETDPAFVACLQVLILSGEQDDATRAAFPHKPVILQTETEDAFLPAFHLIKKSHYVGHVQQVPQGLSVAAPCESSILRLSMYAPHLMEQMRACYQTRFDVLDLQLGKIDEDTQSLTLLTNCENTSLWVDGRPYGGTVKTQSPDRTVHISPDFGYAEAVGFRDGREVARVQIEPVGNPYALSLSTAFAPEKQSKGDILWVNCNVLDSEGRAVPGVEEEITVTLRGGACFDANPNHPKGENFSFRLQNGHCAIALRRTEPRNPISLEVFSDRYVSTSLLLK